ncbi:metal ABC transporter ATP-binding protein [soil metagenome]
MPTPSANRRDPAIVLSDVCLGYGRTTVLHDVSMAIHAGTITALVGPNGSGKSTLLNAIAGLMPRQRGSITVHGLPPERQRRQIAYVQQRTDDNKLLPISGREVVRMGRYAHRGLLGRFRPEDRAAVGDALARMDATALADHQLRELSGGQQQRILIAQGLAQRGSVLMLDEPVTGLDLTSRAAILDVIADEREAGVAIVMTTHDLSEARSADQVVLLAGRVIATGPPSGVLTRDNLVAAYGREPSMVGPEWHLDDPHHD